MRVIGIGERWEVEGSDMIDFVRDKALGVRSFSNKTLLKESGRL